MLPCSFIIRAPIRGVSLQRSVIHASLQLYKYLVVEILIKKSSQLNFPQGAVLTDLREASPPTVIVPSADDETFLLEIKKE